MKCEAVVIAELPGGRNSGEVGESWQYYCDITWCSVYLKGTTSTDAQSRILKGILALFKLFQKLAHSALGNAEWPF